MKGSKSIVYLSLMLGMMIYAVPQLHMGEGLTMPTIFAVVWLSFALLIVAAHLHDILGVGHETRQELESIRRMRRRQRLRKLGGGDVVHARK